MENLSNWISQPPSMKTVSIAGEFFPHLSQAVRHAISIPSARQQDAASIVTQSGEQYGWPEICLLNDHIRNAETRRRN
ncbi:hypothetical protein SLT36_31640 (plasmid) [Aminobacter sp. BA135]|uniref:hypothetical protein n=1 Tax=Aminobacter sp. BA135 TaxID=537596 RepID=UPI003D7BFCE4